MAEIKEIKPVKKEEYLLTLHSHIKGLGLDDKGEPLFIGDGLVGQLEARKAAGIVVNLIKEGKMAGKGILFVGPPGTGKTALAVAIARELGEDTPFVSIYGAEIYSSEAKKTEVLMRAVRKAMGVKIREKRTVYEGVVSSIKLAYVRHPFNPYVRVPREARITLETKDDTLTLNVGEEVTSQLTQLRIRKGDHIWIDAETGVVHKVGRVKGIERAKYYDIEPTHIESEKPSGPVKKEKEIINVFTFNDLDVYIASQRFSITGLFGVEFEREIDEDVRKSVNSQVKKWIDEGKAEILPGVLFIDDAHLLDLEAFSFLTKVLESEFSPILILATNRGITKIRGTDVEAPHGIPLDLLDRLLLIPVKPYKKEEIREILKIRAFEEGVKLDPEALNKLTELAAQRSLRYAAQLLRPAAVVAKRKGKDEIQADDIDEVSTLFVDTRTSTELMKKYESLFIK